VRVHVLCLWFSVSFGLFTWSVESYLFSTQVSVSINPALRLAPDVDVTKSTSAACILYSYQLDIQFCKRLPGLPGAHKVPNAMKPVAVLVTFSLPSIIAI
jgi:hypothetical protein